MWRRDRVLKRDWTRKLAHKWAALYALPTDELRREALVVDPFVPFHLRHALITPPLAGFHGAEEAERETARAAQEAAAAAKRAASAAAAVAAAGAVVSASGRRALVQGTVAALARGGRARGGTRAEDIDFASLLGGPPPPPPPPKAKKAGSDGGSNNKGGGGDK